MAYKLFVMDVDGTLTDGKIYMGVHGEIMKAFNIKDGLGISLLLRPCGIEPIIITGRQSVILENRCKELGVCELHQNVADKVERLNIIIHKYACCMADVIYIGDDINDLPVMEEVKKAGGIVGCPKDAVTQVKEIASFVSEYVGGNGAVRDLIEWIIKKQK